MAGNDPLCRQLGMQLLRNPKKGGKDYALPLGVKMRFGLINYNDQLPLFSTPLLLCENFVFLPCPNEKVCQSQNPTNPC